MPTYIALKALDILCDILFKYIEQNLPFLLFGNQKRITSRKSIIRIIGSNLPLPKAPRVTFNLAVWRQNTLNEELSPVANVKAILNEVEQEELSPIEDTKTYKKLEEELEKLKRQVATILENQRNFSSLATDLTKKSAIQECVIPPPPPPPPPMLMCTPVKLVKSRNVNKRNKPGIDALITEIKNGPPKLKPIARSPGGRPIKPPRLGPLETADALRQVLEKRFIACQLSDDSDLSSNFITDIQSPPNK